MKLDKLILPKEVIKMTKAICYEEVCEIASQIHLRNWILLGLAVAVMIEVAIIANTAMTLSEFLNIAIYPTDF